ncbi:MAG: hypothetical protein U0531_08855 [Dehalococcoidia bacterium]
MRRGPGSTPRPPVRSRPRSTPPSGWRCGRDARRAASATRTPGPPSPTARRPTSPSPWRTWQRREIAGSGPMGVRAARNLRERFGSSVELALAGRTPARAARAAEADARALDLAALPDALAWADAAVVGLHTSRAVIGAGHVAPRPAHRPLLIVDLSVPRAVDDDVHDVAGVHIRNVDAFAGEGGRTRWDGDEREHIARIVDLAVAEYTARAEPTDAVTTLTTLRMQADAVRRAQLERTLRRLPHLDEEARWTIDALTRAIVNRLLHEPTMRLRDDQDGTVAQMTRQLFLEPRSPALP